jgi:hypothetical protein
MAQSVSGLMVHFTPLRFRQSYRSGCDVDDTADHLFDLRLRVPE